MTGIETKIAKLLAQAEGTTNQAEAEIYMAMAENLMLKHGVERAQLEASRPGTRRDPNIVTERIYVRNGHGYAMALANIGHSTAPIFSVRTFQNNHNDGARTVWFVGHSSDVADAVRLFNSLVAQAVPAAKAWWKAEGKAAQPRATDNDAYKARREFIFAFASGAGERLRETRRVVVEEAGAGTELVLLDRSKVVDGWIDANMRVGKGRATQRSYGTAAATHAGRQAGREAVNPKAIK